MKPERLDKLVSDRTDLSRAEARQAIRAGRVQVAGQPVYAPEEKTDPALGLRLDGKALRASQDLYLLLHKPRGLLTAARDSRAATVMDLLPEAFLKNRCMPVGRLDKDTSGLLLLMSDGELAHRLLSPRRQVQKVYEALVEGLLDQADVAAFEAGIALSDFTALPARLQILRAGAVDSLCRVSLTEGKNRQVRRMLGSRGHEVLTLKRLQFGPLTLDEGLAEGAYRELHPEEVHLMRKAVQLV